MVYSAYHCLPILEFGCHKAIPLRKTCIFLRSSNQVFPIKVIVYKKLGGQMVGKNVEISRRGQMLPKVTNIYYVPSHTWHCARFHAEVNPKWYVFSHSSTRRQVNCAYHTTGRNFCFSVYLFCLLPKHKLGKEEAVYCLLLPFDMNLLRAEILILFSDVARYLKNARQLWLTNKYFLNWKRVPTSIRWIVEEEERKRLNSISL